MRDLGTGSSRIRRHRHRSLDGSDPLSSPWESIPSPLRRRHAVAVHAPCKAGSAPVNVILFPVVSSILSGCAWQRCSTGNNMHISESPPIFGLDGPSEPEPVSVSTDRGLGADERAVLCRRRRVLAIEAISEFVAALAFALPFEFVGLLVCSPTFLDWSPEFLDHSPNFLDSSPNRVGPQGDPLGAAMRAEGARATVFPVR